MVIFNETSIAIFITLFPFILAYAVTTAIGATFKNYIVKHIMAGVVVIVTVTMVSSMLGVMDTLINDKWSDIEIVAMTYVMPIIMGVVFITLALTGIYTKKHGKVEVENVTT